MKEFLSKHFNKLTEQETKPACDALALPKMDEDIKEQLRAKGKDPHLGSEKSLYRIQDQVLEVTGRLTCLWADFLNTRMPLQARKTHC